MYVPPDLAGFVKRKGMDSKEIFSSAINLFQICGHVNVDFTKSNNNCKRRPVQDDSVVSYAK